MMLPQALTIPDKLYAFPVVKFYIFKQMVRLIQSTPINPSAYFTDLCYLTISMKATTTAQDRPDRKTSQDPIPLQSPQFYLLPQLRHLIRQPYLKNNPKALSVPFG